MEKISKEIFKRLYRPPVDSHKGQNGKLTIIGGSHLFHGASLWSLKIASRIVDMVFYSTVEENVELTKKLKSQIYDFICVPRDEVEEYIKESDAVLIGPGLERQNQKPKTKNQKHIPKNEKTERSSVDWETDTRGITQYLLARFPNKKWIIDAGSLQMMSPEWLKKLANVVVTPHLGEFRQLFKVKSQKLKVKNPIKNSKFYENLKTPPRWPRQTGTPQRWREKERVRFQKVKSIVFQKAKDYGCIIVLKGPIDIVCSPTKCAYDSQGNPGMTKGGTGDVLAGLIAALSCKNDLFLASCAGVFAQGMAGDRLFARVGPYFNASDLCEEIPKVLKNLVGC